ncbi:MAG TPA: class I SAM-dependent methyltransferase [Chthoniobacter sp.]
MISSRKEIRGADVASHYDELDGFYRDIWGEHVHHGLWLTGDESRTQAVRQLAELVAREAQIREGTRVMDIGCGYGATARLLARELGADVTGMTISEAQYRIACEGNVAELLMAEHPTSNIQLPTSNVPPRNTTSRSASAGEHSKSGVDQSAKRTSLHPSSFILHPSPTFLLGDWLTNTLPADSFDAAIAIESSEHMDKPGFFAQAQRILRPGGRLVVTSWLARENPTRNQERWLIEPISREGRMPHLGSETDYRKMAADAGFAVERFQDVTRQIARTWPMIVRVFLWRLLCKPAYLRFILDPRSQNAIFGLTIVRLWIAFRTGAMRYGVFTLHKL